MADLTLTREQVAAIARGEENVDFVDHRGESVRPRLEVYTGAVAWERVEAAPADVLVALAQRVEAAERQSADLFRLASARTQDATEAIARAEQAESAVAAKDARRIAELEADLAEEQGQRSRAINAEAEVLGLRERILMETLAREMQRTEAAEHRAVNHQTQWQYIVGEVSGLTGVKYDEPSDVVECVRQLLADAEDHRAKATAAEARAQRLAEVCSEAVRIATEATNGWACFAKRKCEHTDIARLHREIGLVRGGLAALAATPQAQETK